jgi:hypothetical protein
MSFRGRPGGGYPGLQAAGCQKPKRGLRLQPQPVLASSTAIDGSSVLSSERQEYAEILAANHGDINAVIAFIRKRADRGP